jgi:hypothetical protein
VTTAWLWAAGLLGAGLRAYLLFATDGSLDAPILGAHGGHVLERGLVPYYETRAALAPGIGALPPFNHPPPIAWGLAGLAWLAQATGISFSFLWRLPFALIDAGTALLLVRLLADHPRRLAIGAAYWLHPLALIFSAYQGNSDSSVAFFAALSLLLVAARRPALAGAAIGLGLWVKIPVLLAAPVLFLALEGARARVLFAAAAGATLLAGWAPALLDDPGAVIRAVVLYPGLQLQTRTGVSVWGVLYMLPDPESLPFALQAAYRAVQDALVSANTWLCVIPIAVCAWCRRDHRDRVSLARGVGASFALVYGFTQAFAFQYFAWSLPFWLCFPRRIALAASAVATAYIYGLYAWLTGSPFLLGTWDFAGRPDWPFPVQLARDAANLFFFGAAIWWTAASLRAARTGGSRPAGS